MSRECCGRRQHTQYILHNCDDDCDEGSDHQVQKYDLELSNEGDCDLENSNEDDDILPDSRCLLPIILNFLTVSTVHDQ